MVRAGEVIEGSSGSLMEAAVGLNDLPGVIFHGMLDPYLKGPLFIHRVHQHGGWDAVDTLFRTPPRSSEQVLHPEKLWGETADEPTAVEIPSLDGVLPSGWTRIHEDVLGGREDFKFVHEFLPPGLRW